MKSIIWSGGGDPLTNHHITETVQYSHGLGLENAMFTNGLGMNNKRTETLSNTLVWIRFHLSADNPKDYSKIHGVPEGYFEVVTRNIKRFIDKEGRTAVVGIGTPVNPDNFEATKGLPELATDMGADYFQAKLDLERLGDFSYSVWWYDVAVPFFLKKKEQLDGKVRLFTNLDQSALEPQYCHAHRVITAITADGEVAFCKMRRGDKQTSLGNINEMALENIIDSDRHSALGKTIGLNNCQIAEVHCPYRKTVQSIELYLQDQSFSIPIPPTMEHINFF